MQQQLSHQAMGYDRSSIMFSPDGRLLQVEYTKETIRHGTSALGIVCKDGVLLVSDKRISERLIVEKSVEKISEIDDHVGATSTGLVMDARILIERAQLIAQQHKMIYETPIDSLSLVKEICDIKQAHTQYGGARPFGVSLLIAGVDDLPKLFVTDPAGIYFQYRATAIGESEFEIKAILEREYKENMNFDAALKLGLGAMKKVLGKKFDIKRIDGVFISSKNKKFERVEKEKLVKLAGE